MHRIIALYVCLGVCFGQTPLKNPGFEEGNSGTAPAGWLVPSAIQKAGFAVVRTDEGCRTGLGCALLTGVQNSPPNMFGNVMQVVPAADYTNQRIRLRSHIRVEGAGTRAQMWMRLDRADHSMALLDNMDNRPVTSPEWTQAEIVVDVPGDISQIALGIILFGSGKVWVDDVQLESLKSLPREPAEGPSPLSGQALLNVTAFARLYGYVRFFHPSDQADATDWDSFAIQGVRAVEHAKSRPELIQTLKKIFEPVAPLIQIGADTKELPKGPQVVRYEHLGVGLAKGGQSAYKTERVRKRADSGEIPVYEALIAPEVRVRVPLAVYADKEGTLPHMPVPEPPAAAVRDARDRATRLAGVIIAWNVFQHFYPYFDVVPGDWSDALKPGLQSAATDATPEDFEQTLNRLVSALHDGHGRVTRMPMTSSLQAPVTFAWVGDQLVVANQRTTGVEGVLLGDRVLSIDGKSTDVLAGELRTQISGATEQWVRYRMADTLTHCRSNKMALELESVDSKRKALELTCVAPKIKFLDVYPEKRPEKVADLGGGIWYVDLDRVSSDDYAKAWPNVKQAKGIIFDMRGYPNEVAMSVLRTLTKDTVRSAKMDIPIALAPDRTNWRWREGGWDIQPAYPKLAGKAVFLTDGRAISYAETVMAFVEYYKLGEIVGGATAGTNGNVNPFVLPGGFRVTWTGMRVLKPGGALHHGVGIQPTVPVTRTREGIAAGKDEILDKAVEILRSGRP